LIDAGFQTFNANGMIVTTLYDPTLRHGCLVKVQSPSGASVRDLGHQQYHL
jgi:hypothetical protein